MAHTLQYIIESWWQRCIYQTQDFDKYTFTTQLANLYQNMIDLT